MTDERFNELLAGPLHHPMPMFAVTRIALALRDVVERCGEAGERALELHCSGRAEQDAQSAGGWFVGRVEG